MEKLLVKEADEKTILEAQKIHGLHSNVVIYPYDQ